MRFNKTMSNNDDADYKDTEKKNNDKTTNSPFRSLPDSDTNLIVVGTIKVDEHSRLTFSKRIKTVFPIFPGDTVVVYQELSNNELIFKVQRHNEISDTWIVKRKKRLTQLPANNTAQDEISKKTTLQEKRKELGQEQMKSNIKIMIIDDEPEILETYKSIMNELNNINNKTPCIIDSFTSSIDAAKHFLEIYKDYKYSTPYYDLIIIDIRIPTINGIQLYQIMKIIDLNIKTLFISALDAVNEIEGILPGIKAEDIIKKPFNIDEFYSKVNDKINSR